MASGGDVLALGGTDGLIELWSLLTLELDTVHFPYQKEQLFMVHGAAILSLNFSRDLKLLASGDQAGTIKVWKISQGKCLRTIDNIQGINNILLSYTNARVIGSTLDSQIKVYGLKSGAMLKEMPKVHDTYIHSL